MQRIRIELAHADDSTTCVFACEADVADGGTLAVHRRYNDQGAFAKSGWQITHIPTGCRLFASRLKRDAYTALQLLDASGLWEFNSDEWLGLNKTERQEFGDRFAEILKSAGLDATVSTIWRVE